MFAASMNQPFAELIVSGQHQAGGKSRGTDYRGPILLHACATRYCCVWDPVEFEAVHGVELPDRKVLTFGAIIALAQLVDVRPEASMPGHQFATGPYVWYFADVRRVEPIRCKGRRGLWTADVEPDQLRFLD